MINFDVLDSIVNDSDLIRWQKSNELNCSCSLKRIKLWLQKLVTDFTNQTPKFKIYEDNTTVKRFAKNPTNIKRLKHIDVKHHSVNDYIDRENLTVEHIGSKRPIG